MAGYTLRQQRIDVDIVVNADITEPRSMCAEIERQLRLNPPDRLQSGQWGREPDLRAFPRRIEVTPSSSDPGTVGREIYGQWAAAFRACPSIPGTSPEEIANRKARRDAAFQSGLRRMGRDIFQDRLPQPPPGPEPLAGIDPEVLIAGRQAAERSVLERARSLDSATRACMLDLFKDGFRGFYDDLYQRGIDITEFLDNLLIYLEGAWDASRDRDTEAAAFTRQVNEALAQLNLSVVSEAAHRSFYTNFDNFNHFRNSYEFGRYFLGFVEDVLMLIPATGTARESALAMHTIMRTTRKLHFGPKKAWAAELPLRKSAKTPGPGKTAKAPEPPKHPKVTASVREGKAPDPFALKMAVAEAAVEASPYKKLIGKTIEVDADVLYFSQTTVSYAKKRNGIRYTYDDILNSLFEHGWPKDKPLDMVIMPPDGRLVSIDNTRLRAARELGVDKYGRPIRPLVRVRHPNEVLIGDRFERPDKNSFPETWGAAARERIKQQNRVPEGEEYGLSSLPKVAGRPGDGSN